MRTAYCGRAAAYESKGDYQKAIADHNMIVLFYAIEAEILTNLDSPNRDKFLLGTAAAYRARSRCLELLGQKKAALADQKRADGLDKEAKKLASKSPTSKEAPIQVNNAWEDVVTLVVDGVTYRLEAGEHKTIPVSAAEVSFEMRAGPHHQTGTLQAGQAYTIRAPLP
jgi:hypothetical protein